MLKITMLRLTAPIDTVYSLAFISGLFMLHYPSPFIDYRMNYLTSK